MRFCFAHAAAPARGTKGEGLMFLPTAKPTGLIKADSYLKPRSGLVFICFGMVSSLFSQRRLE